MLDPAVYAWRLQAHCHGCQWWNGRCRKGHLATSPQGCPVRLFPPVEATGYAPDRPADALEAPLPCGTCGSSSSGTLPDLSWHQVLSHFAESMLRWVAAGAPLVDEKVHAERFGKCKACPHYRGFWCTKCKCIAYAKAKLATESCPDDPPQWKPRS